MRPTTGSSSGAAGQATVLVYDTTTGKRVGDAPIVGDTDDLFYDSPRKRLYVIAGDGFVGVLQQTDRDHLTRMARAPSASGARSGLFVPDQGRLYLAVPRRGAQPSEIRAYHVARGRRLR